MKISFEGKIMIVAGGTGGLGKSVSLAFLNEGATVAVTYRHEEEFAALKGAAGANASALSGHLIDVTDEKQTAKFGEELVTRHGRVDALVNTVGGYGWRHSTCDDGNVSAGSDVVFESTFWIQPVACGVARNA